MLRNKPQHNSIYLILLSFLSNDKLERKNKMTNQYRKLMEEVDFLLEGAFDDGRYFMRDVLKIEEDLARLREYVNSGEYKIDTSEHHGVVGDITFRYRELKESSVELAERYPRVAKEIERVRKEFVGLEEKLVSDRMGEKQNGK